ncbi:MAG: 1-acyl-sn-glycerol-3-phosphate acyltransferase [Bacteroidota bacterium]|nr:1-acyl-sn-glycerol-3-phosphate acyltransferase [Bacteroidota bacterium]
MEPVAANEKFIDVEKVIGNKNSRLLKALPKFLVHYLKRIIHQDELNGAIDRHKNEMGLPFVNSILGELGANYEVVGLENIPTSGRFIFASNHPLGGLDGLVLINEVGKWNPNIKFVVNDLLLNVKNLEPVFVPVNKHGRQSVDYAQKIDAAYRSSDQILYFPAGLCSRKVNGKITDLEWQKSFIVKAIKYQRDILPVYFEGRNSNFFYNLARLRSLLNIKVNIEMLYLVDEMFKQRRKKMRVIFGKPISYTQFDASKTPSEWAFFVRNYVYAMNDKL